MQGHGDRHSGTQTAVVPRDRNTTSCTGDSSANHGSRSNSNSNSVQTCNSPRESQTDGRHIQEPTSAQPRDHNNMERVGLRDTKNRKRKISQAITEGLAVSFSLRKKSRTE